MGLFETGVRPIIDNYLLEESKKVRSYGEYWSASSAGYCMRKNIFKRLGVPENNEGARRQRVFTSGHVFHNWIQELTRAAGASIVQEAELQDEQLMVRGHFDDLIDIDGSPVLYDYKTVNSRSFMWAKKNGNAMSHFHRMQLGTYMYMLRSGALVVPETADYPFDVAKYDIVELTEARILKIEKDALSSLQINILINNRRKQMYGVKQPDIDKWVSAVRFFEQTMRAECKAKAVAAESTNVIERNELRAIVRECREQRAAYTNFIA